MKVPTKRATRRLAASLAIATALASGGAWAATQTFVWKGKSAPNTSNWSDLSCWYYHNTGSWRTTDPASLPDANNYPVYFRDGYTEFNTAKYFADGWDHVVTFSGAQRVGNTARHPVYVDAGSTSENPIVFAATQDSYGLTCSQLYLGATSSANGYLEIRNGTYQTTGELSIGYKDSSGGSMGHLAVGDGVTVRTGANFALYKGDVAINGGNVTVGDTLHIAYRGSGEFALNGGEVDVATEIRFGGYYAYDPTGLYLNGGMLSTPTIVWHNGNTTAGVVFNGGTLKAKSDGILIENDDHIAVSVGDGGGTIDNGGHAISIPKAISGTGGMTFKGNGTITLSGANSYSGPTYVTPGTILAVKNETAKNNILANGLVVLSVPTEGQTVMTCTSALDDADLTKISSPLRPTTEFVFSDEGKTNIVVGAVGPELDNYWTGAANDGDLSNAANWKGDVPTTGTANIFCETNSTLMKGEMFAPTAITFLAGSAAVTINGEFSGITQIANNSASMVEFKDAVAFAGNVDVVQNSGAVKFTGGATGTQLARATDIHGTYTFSQTGDLTEIANTTVKSDGVYNLLNGTFHKHNADFHVEAGGKAVVKNAKISHSQSKTLLGAFNGLFVVTNQFLVQGNITHYLSTSGSGTLVVNELRVNQNGKVALVKAIIGPDGIIRGEGYVRVYDNGSSEFGSYADWTMYYDSKGSNTSTDKPVFYKTSSSSTWSSLTFDTTDYYDNTIGRTITCEAPISAADAASAAKFRVTVKGKGKFVFANTSNGNIFSGGLIVQDAATVEVKANAKPGKGTITLGAGTTLALTSTSSTFTALTNSLNLPTEGAATIRIDGERLKAGDHIIATVGNAATSANVALDENSAVLAGRKAELRVEDGKLLLNIKSAGTIFIVR